MTIVGLSCVLLGLIAGLLAVMYLLQRRALRLLMMCHSRCSGLPSADA